MAQVQDPQGKPVVGSQRRLCEMLVGTQVGTHHTHSGGTPFP